jgi:hypothetical protein
MSLDSDTWLAGGSTAHRSFSTFMPMSEAAMNKNHGLVLRQSDVRPDVEC